MLEATELYFDSLEMIFLLDAIKTYYTWVVIETKQNCVSLDF